MFHTFSGQTLNAQTFKVCPVPWVCLICHRFVSRTLNVQTFKVCLEPWFCLVFHRFLGQTLNVQTFKVCPEPWFCLVFHMFLAQILNVQTLKVCPEPSLCLILHRFLGQASRAVQACLVVARRVLQSWPNTKLPILSLDANHCDCNQSRSCAQGCCRVALKHAKVKISKLNPANEVVGPRQASKSRNKNKVKLNC